MAIVQVFIPQFLQLDHSLLSVSAFLSPCGHVFLFSISCPPPYSPPPPIPPVIRIVCQVPMAHRQKQWEGDSGTIHGTRMVFIFLTAMQSQSSCVLPVVWWSRRKNRDMGKGGQIELEGEMEAAKQNCSQVTLRDGHLSLIPLAISATLRLLRAFPLSRFLPSGPAPFLQLWKSSINLSVKHTYCACAPPLLRNSIITISITKSLLPTPPPP